MQAIAAEKYTLKDLLRKAEKGAARAAEKAVQLLEQRDNHNRKLQLDLKETLDRVKDLTLK